MGQGIEHVHRNVAAEQARVGVQRHRGLRQRLGDGAKVALDAARRHREHLLQDQDQTIRAQSCVRLCLPDGVAGGECRDTREHGHALRRGVDHDAHDLLALLERQIGELAGAPERRQAVHAAADQVFDQVAQHALAHAPGGFVDRGYEIGKYSVKVGHGAALVRLKEQAR